MRPQIRHEFKASFPFSFSEYITAYWAIQAGLLTPSTFAQHRLSPLAAFTSSAYFTMEGGDSEFANFTLPTLKAFWRPVVILCMAISNNLLLML